MGIRFRNRIFMVGLLMMNWSGPKKRIISIGIIRSATITAFSVPEFLSQYVKYDPTGSTM